MNLSSRPRLPDLFLVGAQKAGTSSLFDWLSQHPGIEGPASAKDFPFFAEDQLFSQGIENYARKFPSSTGKRYLMTGSVQYLFFPEALSRIRKFCPDAKILVLLREPVDRAISAYRFAIQRGIEPRSIDDAILDELVTLDSDEAYSERIERFQKFYVKRGMYGEQLLRLYNIFPPEQVFVGLFDDMVNQPVSFLERLFQFLELESASIDVRKKNVTAGLPRSQTVSKLYFSNEIRGSSALTLLRNFLPHSVRFRLRKLILALNTDKQGQATHTLSDRVRQSLREIFRADLQRLGTQDAQKWLRLWGLEPAQHGHGTQT